MKNEHLTDITKREFFVRGMDQREACVFSGKLVCVMDAVITRITKSSFICRAENSGVPFAAHVALDLHFLSSNSSSLALSSQNS